MRRRTFLRQATRGFAPAGLASHTFAQRIFFESWPGIILTPTSPMLAASDGRASIDFYEPAFGAELLWP
jgi:hypothetical protein